MSDETQAHQRRHENLAPPPPDLRWFRTGAWLVFAAAFFSMAFVHHPQTGWNVNTRLALVFAVADEHTFSIDSYHAVRKTETGDKAFFEGHFYSDKVFGVSLLALPFYQGMKLLAGGAPPFQAANYVLRLFAVSLPAAASVALLWMLVVRLGGPPRRALAAAGAAFWGSLWYGCSTVFLPYAPGIACLLGALYIVFFPRARRVTFANTAVVGLLCGYSALCDFIFAPAAALVGGVLAMRLVDQGAFFGMRAFARMKGDRSNGRTCLALLAVSFAGASLPVLLFAWYSASIFGSPTIPYEFEFDPLFREGMRQGFMGVTSPSPHALWFLTLHPFRGILFWSPWIVLAVAGAVLWTRSAGKRRIVGWAAAVSFAFYVLFNAGYYMWWGGWCMGPRLMLPMFALLPVALAEVVRVRKRPYLWWTFAVLGTVAIALNMPVAVMEPQIPQGNPTDLLFAARIGDSLAVPQAVYWRWFFSPQTYLGIPGNVLSHGGAVLAPLLLMILAARILPARHEAFERLELPFVNWDGTAAPLPQTVPKRA